MRYFFFRKRKVLLAPHFIDFPSELLQFSKPLRLSFGCIFEMYRAQQRRELTCFLIHPQKERMQSNTFLVDSMLHMIHDCCNMNNWQWESNTIFVFLAEGEESKCNSFVCLVYCCAQGYSADRWKVCSTGSDGDRNSFVVVVLVRSLIAGRTANDMFVKLLCLVGNWKSQVFYLVLKIVYFLLLIGQVRHHLQ